MKVVLAVRLPDGSQVDREPTEEELQRLAERYAVSLLQASLAGSRVQLKRHQKEAAAGS